MFITFFLPHFDLKPGQCLPLGTLVEVLCSLDVEFFWTACNIQISPANALLQTMIFGNSKLQPHDPTAPEEGLRAGDIYKITKTLPVKHIIANIHSPLNHIACGFRKSLKVFAKGKKRVKG